MTSPRYRCSTAVTLGLLIAAVLPASVGAQEAVRVVEAVSGTTGDRQRYVVRDLDEAEIKAVQAALRDQGYVGIGWTGRLDDGTVEGLRRLQRERGLVECGCISYETIVALGLRPDVPALLGACDLFVSTSRNEGLPLNVMEAMAAAVDPALHPLAARSVGAHLTLLSDEGRIAFEGESVVALQAP